MMECFVDLVGLLLRQEGLHCLPDTGVYPEHRLWRCVWQNTLNLDYNRERI